jgi:hypothetical protein
MYIYCKYDYYTIAIFQYYEVTVYAGLKTLWLVKETHADLELNWRKTDKCVNCWWQKYVTLFYWVESPSEHEEYLHWLQ